MPKFIGEAEALIRFIKRVLDIPPQKAKQCKVKKVKKPHPRGMP